MTNTHITVGGHKITTNKVGQVHTITNLTSGFSGYFSWVVVNGICYLSSFFLCDTIGNEKVVSTTPIPKPKSGFFCWGTAYSNRGAIHVDANATQLKANILTADSNLYASVAYPVSDDWVES